MNQAAHPVQHEIRTGLNAFRADVLQGLLSNRTNCRNRHGERLHRNPTRLGKSSDHAIAVERAAKDTVVDRQVSYVVEHEFLHPARVEREVFFFLHVLNPQPLEASLDDCTTVWHRTLHFRRKSKFRFRAAPCIVPLQGTSLNFRASGISGAGKIRAFQSPPATPGDDGRRTHSPLLSCVAAVDKSSEAF